MEHNRVKLRAVEPEDLDMLYQIENDSELWKVGTANVPYSRYVLHDYIAHQTNDIYADKQVRQVITVGAKAEAVGMIDIVNFDPCNLRAEVGVVVQHRFCHQGYAHEALLLLLNYAKNTLHLHQLYAVVDTANHDSIALFEHSGFQRGPILKDWLYDGRQHHDALLLQIIL